MNNKAQIGETMTWMVGTIIIIIMLAMSVFILSSSLFENDRKISLRSINSDLIVTKSFLGYLLTGDNFNQLRNTELRLVTDSVSRSDDEIVKKIFFELGSNEYSGDIWLGVLKEGCGWNKDTQTNVQPSCAPNKRKVIASGCITGVFYDRIKLNDDSIAELMIGCKK